MHIEWREQIVQRVARQQQVNILYGRRARMAGPRHVEDHHAAGIGRHHMPPEIAGPVPGFLDADDIVVDLIRADSAGGTRQYLRRRAGL